MNESVTASAESFNEYVLARIARNPSLIGECTHFTRGTTSAAVSPSVSSVQRRLVHTAATQGPFAKKGEKDDKDDVSTTTGAPSLQSASTGILKQPESPEEKAGKTALVMRALVDRPLLPLGAEHLIHDVVWPAVAKAAQAAKEVFHAREALAKSENDAVYDDGAQTATAATGITSSSVLGDGEVKRAEEEKEARKLSVQTREAALAEARAELVLAFTTLRRRMAAMEAYLEKPVVRPQETAAEVDGTATSRKRPRDDDARDE